MNLFWHVCVRFMGFVEGIMWPCSGRSFDRLLIFSSMRWLKQQLKRLGLKRRRNSHHLGVVASCIAVCLIKYWCVVAKYNVTQEELCTSNSLLGYRSMWKLLRDKYHITINRQAQNWSRRGPPTIFPQIETKGVYQQGITFVAWKCWLEWMLIYTQGPSFQWHIDQYDKLANYGIYIHGCIDGFVIPRTCNIVSDVLFRFSRKILWLHVEATKPNSKVVLGYYLQIVGYLKGKIIIIEVEVKYKWIWRMSPNCPNGQRYRKRGCGPVSGRIPHGSCWWKGRSSEYYLWVITNKLCENCHFKANC